MLYLGWVEGIQLCHPSPIHHHPGTPCTLGSEVTWGYEVPAVDAFLGLLCTVSASLLPPLLQLVFSTSVPTTSSPSGFGASTAGSASSPFLIPFFSCTAGRLTQMISRRCKHVSINATNTPNSNCRVWHIYLSICQMWFKSPEV